MYTNSHLCQHIAGAEHEFLPLCQYFSDGRLFAIFAPAESNSHFDLC